MFSIVKVKPLSKPKIPTQSWLVLVVAFNLNYKFCCEFLYAVYPWAGFSSQVVFLPISGLHSTEDLLQYHKRQPRGEADSMSQSD